MSDNEKMSKSATEDLRVVAVVQFNHGEALVLNRSVQFVYEQVGNDFVGKDGPFRDYLYYSRGGSAFAGRELSLTMSDGSVKAIKDHWWHGTPKGAVDVPIGDVESLRKCYVFYSGSLSQDDFLALRSTYTGCVYPYWDYEKVIKHKDLLGRYAHESGRCNVLVKEVKKKHLEAEGLRAKVAELEAKLAALAKQEPVAWYVDDEEGREYNGTPQMSNGRTGFPLYARPVPAEPVNARLVERIKEAIDAYERFGAICTFEGEPMIHASTLLEIAGIAAEAQQAGPNTAPADMVNRAFQDGINSGYAQAMMDEMARHRQAEPELVEGAPCRNALWRDGKPFPKSSCQRCGTLLRPGWKCADGVEV